MGNAGPAISLNALRTTLHWFCEAVLRDIKCEIASMRQEIIKDISLVWEIVMCTKFAPQCNAQRKTKRLQKLQMNTVNGGKNDY